MSVGSSGSPTPAMDPIEFDQSEDTPLKTRININVGGSLFMTRLGTISMRDSMLKRLFINWSDSKSGYNLKITFFKLKLYSHFRMALY